MPDKISPKISVIIPVHNMASYLSECLNSVLAQNLQELEVIIIDDGSTDTSAEIITDYSRTAKHIRFIRQQKMGVSVARNLGIKLACGEFLAFMDADDYYPDSRVLEDLYKAARDHKVKIAGGSFSLYDMKVGLVITKFTGLESGYTFSSDGQRSYASYQFDYGWHRFIYDRRFLLENKILMPPYSRFQDPPFFVRAMTAASTFYALKRVVYRYRQGHQARNFSLSQTKDIIRGITYNLVFSRKHDLIQLHTISCLRLISEYNHIIKRWLYRPSCWWCLVSAIKQVRVKMLNKFCDERGSALKRILYKRTIFGIAMIYLLQISWLYVTIDFCDIDGGVEADPASEKYAIRMKQQKLSQRYYNTRLSPNFRLGFLILLVPRILFFVGRMLLRKGRINHE